MCLYGKVTYASTTFYRKHVRCKTSAKTVNSNQDNIDIFVFQDSMKLNLSVYVLSAVQYHNSILLKASREVFQIKVSLSQD